MVQKIQPPEPAEMGAAPRRAHESLPTDPLRLKAFTKFFRAYMAAAFGVALLPVSLAKFGAVDAFADEEKMLSLFTSLFCFLTLAFIFYQRHALGRWMFPEFTVEEAARGDSIAASDETQRSRLEALRRVRWGKRAAMTAIPLVLILSAAYCAWMYVGTVDQGIVKARFLYPLVEAKRATLLMQSSLDNPFVFPARGYYVALFVTAEAAFIMMATKEYLQDLLGLEDREVIRGRRHAVVSPNNGSTQTPPTEPIAAKRATTEQPRVRTESESNRTATEG